MQLINVEIMGIKLGRRVFLVVLIASAHAILHFAAGAPLWPVLISAALTSIFARYLFRDNVLHKSTVRITEDLVGAQISAPEIAQRVLERFPDPLAVVNRDQRIIFSNADVASPFPQARAGRHLTTISRSPDLSSAVERVFETRARRRLSSQRHRR